MTTPVRSAATVVLLRDSDDGLETWLLRRTPRMAFAAGMSVFPGGRVEAGDGADDVPWRGGDPVDPAAGMAARFGCSVATVRAAVVAAVRETFEETGVLLTTPTWIGSPTPLRRAVESGDTPFAQVLTDRGLVIDAELIRPWARWITPEGEPRRYDTYFYVAALPVGAVAVADSGEAVEAEWVRPADALAQLHDGRRPMLPPTWLTLQELGRFAGVADVLTASDGRSLPAVQPERVVNPDGTVSARLPDGSVFSLPTV